MFLRKILLTIILGLFLLPGLGRAESKQTEIYFFYSKNCTHCKNVEPKLDALAAKYPEISLQKFEVYYDAENRKLFQKLSSIFGEPIQSVPTIIINNQVYIGESDATLNAIENDILACQSSTCINPSVTISAWEKAHPDADKVNNHQLLGYLLGGIGGIILLYVIYLLIKKIIHGRRNN